MSVEAHRCNEENCKGFIVFENADFKLTNPPEVNGMYEFDNPHCTECGKEYKVVPHYTVISVEENGEVNQAKPASITDFEWREKIREIENETNPYEKMELYLALTGCSYSVGDVVIGYDHYMNGAYVSHTMEDCVMQLKEYLEETQATKKA